MSKEIEENMQLLRQNSTTDKKVYVQGTQLMYGKAYLVNYIHNGDGMTYYGYFDDWDAMSDNFFFVNTTQAKTSLSINGSSIASVDLLSEVQAEAPPTQASALDHNVGESDYAKHKIQPWHVWEEYDLNGWDCDIVKRVLRNKTSDSREMDYEKIIHICQYRLEMIKRGA